MLTKITINTLSLVPFFFCFMHERLAGRHRQKWLAYINNGVVESPLGNTALCQQNPEQCLS